MTRPMEIRARLVDLLRRDLVDPGPKDEDLARERLSEKPLALVFDRLHRAQGRRGRGR
jgi:hypothetical protein